MALIVSVSGIRGIVGEELTPEVVQRYAAAFGATLGGGKVAVGRDSRPSGSAFRDAVVAGLRSANCTCIDLGILPTPTCGFLVRELACQGAIQITASHNPSPYNGLKLFGPDGAVLSASAGATIQARFLQDAVVSLVQNPPGSPLDRSASAQLHLDRVCSCIDAKRISNAAFKVVLDANGGAGGPLAVQFLKSLNCAIIPIGCEPDGNFRHDPEPLPKHLHEIEAIVRSHPGSIGAVLDPDADRLVLIDESGQCLSEEWTLALAVQQRLSKDKGPVVINLSTSLTTEDIAKAAGVPCYRSAVGEANVVAKMREVGAVVGGEGNGGVIDPYIGWVRDPFIGLGLILERMAVAGHTLQQLAAQLPRYIMRKEKFTIDKANLPNVCAEIRNFWPNAEFDESDGLRLSWPDRWIQLRASNTEPVARLIGEAHDSKSLDEMFAQCQAILSD